MAIESEKDFLFIKQAIEQSRAEAAKKTYNINIPTEADPNPDYEAIKEAHEKSMQRAAENINKLLNAFLDAWPTLRLERIRDFAEYEFLEAAPQEIKDIEFFIFMQPETEGMYIADFFRQCYTEDWQPIQDSPYTEVIERAKGKAKEYAKDRFKTLQLFAETPTEKNTLAKVMETYLPLDKFNVMTLFANQELPTGQQKLDTLGDPEHPVLWTADFSALDELSYRTSKKLTYFEMVTMSVADALYRQNNIFSLTQLCKTMYMGVNKSNRTKLFKQLEKMDLVKIEIDNAAEAEASEYDRVYYKGSVYPIEIVAGEINGKMTNAAIHPLKTAPLIEYARIKRQFATVPLYLLDIKTMDKTDNNMNLLCYLIIQISKLKTGHRDPHFRYDTLCSEFNITPKHQAEFKKKVEKILTHFKEKNWIYDYDTQKSLTSVSVYVSKQVTPKAKATKKTAAEKKKRYGKK